ncbi:MAG: hypothetical protein WC162_04305 [Sphaerochaetaceae bacterium]
MTVCKFGGSSLSCAKQIKKVSEILKSDPNRTLAVVSAPGKRFKEDIKITDLLYEIYDLASMNKVEETKVLFKIIKKRYLEICENLDIPESNIKSFLQEILHNILSKKSLSYCASRGEFLNAKIISTYLDWDFLESGNYLKLTAERQIHPLSWSLLNSVDFSKKYVVPGFYGTDLNNKILTFSRGGSDITGACFSRAAKANLYENWTDVNGVFNADPRIIKEATPIKSLTYEQMNILSRYGANVLHPDVFKPLITNPVTINVKNTNSPKEIGTMITLEKENNSNYIGITNLDQSLCIVGDCIDNSKIDTLFKGNNINFKNKQIFKSYCLYEIEQTSMKQALNLLHSSLF